MPNRKKNDPDQLQTVIDNLLLEISTTSPDTDRYNDLLTKLERLNEMRDSTPEKRKPVDPNTLITAGTSIATVLIIVGYEHAHVVTSKALSFVLKK